MTPTILVVALVVAAAICFDVYCLVDLRRSRVRHLSKWGWALVTAGCLLLSLGDFFWFEKTHAGFFMVRGLFALLFFLYLVRPEVRERLV